MTRIDCMPYTASAFPRHLVEWGTLCAAESAEEAQLLARVLAFEQSPEGLARRRIFQLELDTFSRGPSPAEQDELDRLRKLYPDVPLDDDDPLKEAIEAWGRAAEGLRSARAKIPRGQSST
jgi:hypothetical protein